MFGLDIPIFIGAMCYVFFCGVCGGAWGIGMGWAVLPMLFLLFPADVIPRELLSGACVLHIVAKCTVATIADLGLSRRIYRAQRGRYLFLACISALGVGIAYLVRYLLLRYGVDVDSAKSLALVVTLATVLGGIAVVYALGKIKRIAAVLRAEHPSVMAIAGVLTGFLSGFLGIGGGVLRYPLHAVVQSTPADESRYLVQGSVLTASVLSLIMYWAQGKIAWDLAWWLCLPGVVGHMIGWVVPKFIRRKGQPVAGDAEEQPSYTVYAFVATIILFLVMSLLVAKGKDFPGHLVLLFGITMIALVLIERRWPVARSKTRSHRHAA